MDRRTEIGTNYNQLLILGKYNDDRLHSALGYLSPMEYEKERLPKAAVA